MALNPTTWKHLSPLLDEALDLPASEWEPWLAALQARDPDLAAQVRTLLGAEGPGQQALGLLDSHALAAMHRPLAGQRLGAYILVEPIGEGGMGAVWLAERSDGRFEGRVAVKLLHSGLVRPALAERFQREGNFLARLAHPHIARLLDAGLTAEGQPYLVLEHVQGQAIDQWCDERGLSVAKRVALFEQVLQAVAHAHARLLVHRDIKPSNVMVTADGQVKLLDFGIAKLLGTEDGAGEATALTREGGQALTPLFAAPEQLQGQAITTATDVYALGLLLYLLLTGQHPSLAADGQRLPMDSTQPRASKVVNDHGRRSPELLQQAARARGQDGTRLARQLAGDLDNILAKCLKPDPAVRYGTVAALADDLRRHLQGMTVSARPDTLGYRVSRFLRRYRLAVGATALAMMALSVTAGVALWQWRETRIALKDAEFSSRRAIAANTFANEWMRAVTADIAEPQARRALLDKARHILRTQRFEEDPTIHAYLLNHLSARYAQAGWPRAQVEVSQEADAMLPPGTSALDRSYSASMVSIALNQTGQIHEALARAEVAHTFLRGVDDVEALSQALQAEGLAASNAGQHDRAVAAAANGHRVLAEAGRSVMPMYRILRAQEATALWRAGRAPEAAQRAQELLVWLEESKTSHTLTGQRMQALLARLAAQAGDEAAVRAALAQPWASGPKGRELLLWPQAWLLAREGRPVQARELHRQAAATWAEGGAKLSQFEDTAEAFELSLRINRAAALRDEWPALRALGEECAALGADVKATMNRLHTQAAAR